MVCPSFVPILVKVSQFAVSLICGKGALFCHWSLIITNAAVSTTSAAVLLLSPFIFALLSLLYFLVVTRIFGYLAASVK